MVSLRKLLDSLKLHLEVWAYSVYTFRGRARSAGCQIWVTMKIFENVVTRSSLHFLSLAFLMLSISIGSITSRTMVVFYPRSPVVILSLNTVSKRKKYRNFHRFDWHGQDGCWWYEILPPWRRREMNASCLAYPWNLLFVIGNYVKFNLTLSYGAEIIAWRLPLRLNYVLYGQHFA